MQMLTDAHSLPEQIAWLRERVADAELLRRLFVTSGQVNADKAERDAAMWRAVLNTLCATAKCARRDAEPNLSQSAKSTATPIVNVSLISTKKAPTGS